MEIRKEVKVYNVYNYCEDCNEELIRHNNFIIWDNNDNTVDLTNNKINYRYYCGNCDKEFIEDKSYPFQEFIEI